MILSLVNGISFYMVVGIILLFISVMCIVFMIKSYRAGVAIGMDKAVLKRSVTSSVTFTILPSISILLGVIALSGSLGVPLSWLRLSVVGSLHYELSVAEIAAANFGLSGLKAAEMTAQAYATIALVMTAGITCGGICCIFILKKYLGKLQRNPKQQQSGKQSSNAILMVGMFIGLCSAYIGSYVGIFVTAKDYLPIATALCAAVVMLIFEYFTIKKGKAWLDNFSVAASMLVAMAAAVLLNRYF